MRLNHTTTVTTVEATPIPHFWAIHNTATSDALELPYNTTQI